MEKIFDLTNKSVVVTGGGSGIGKAISILFAKQGASVTILDVNIEQAESVAKELREQDLKVVAVQCNIANQSEVIKTIQTINQIDILVNNAAIAHVGNLESTSEEDLDRLLSVNVKGVYNVLYATVPQMKKNGGGTILNLNSIASLVGLNDRFGYSLTKGAVHAMTLSIAKDYLKHNIRCNSISPARVHTPFVDGFLAKNYPGKESEMFDKLSRCQPLGRMGKPSEIAFLALYLCSDEASFISGNDYPIDGGYLNLHD